MFSKLIKFSTNINKLAREIQVNEPLITTEIFDQLLEALNNIQKKIFTLSRKPFYKQRILKTHILPLTNVAIDRTGNMYVNYLKLS